MWVRIADLVHQLASRETLTLAVNSCLGRLQGPSVWAAATAAVPWANVTFQVDILTHCEIVSAFASVLLYCKLDPIWSLDRSWHPGPVSRARTASESVPVNLGVTLVIWIQVTVASLSIRIGRIYECCRIALTCTSWKQFGIYSGMYWYVFFKYLACMIKWHQNIWIHMNTHHSKQCR